MPKRASEDIFCRGCGKTPERWLYKPIISDELAVAWNLSPQQQKQFSLRESQFCPYCGNSARTRILAQAVMKSFPYKGVTNLKDWVVKANNDKLSVAEINSCGKLHPILSKLTYLAYSEYPSAKLLPRLYYMLKRVRNEDITSLTYPDNSFDLVLHSEVLEHIPDVKKALQECRRILKPGGLCLFTVPYIPTRETRQCAARDKHTGNVIHLRHPSYHGLDQRADNLVWWEFGNDFAQTYKLQIFYTDVDVSTYVFALKK
jgi:SAM-dependent methyltransferase